MSDFTYDRRGLTLTRYRYDTLGRMTRTVYPDNVTDVSDSQIAICMDCMKLEYDLAGRLTRSTDQRGQMSNFTYDRRGLTLTRITGLAQDSYGYDALGRMTLADRGTTSSAAATSHGTYAYNALREMAAETLTFPGGTARMTAYTYDQAGNRLSVMYPSSVAVGYANTAVDQVSAITVNNSALANYTYVGGGHVLDKRRTATSAGATTYYDLQYGYDSHRRVSSVGNSFVAGGGSPLTIASYGFVRDENGNPMQQTAGGIAPFNGDGRNLTVDRLDRLINTTYTANSQTEPQPVDRLGNRESHTPRGGVTTAYTLGNGANEYQCIDVDAGGPGPCVTLTYDNAGNLTMDESGRQYFYDEHDRLTQIKSATNVVLANYTYDAVGRRIVFEDPVAVVTTRYYYDGPNVIEERNGSDVRQRYHMHGGQYIDEHVATFNDASGAFRYYLHNDLYSVVAVGDAGGMVGESYTYGAYGVSTVNGGGCKPGDLDGDNDVDIGDIPQFIAVLLTGTGSAQELCAADVNCDGMVDGRDIQPFDDCLLGASCPGPRGGSGLRSPFTLHGAPVDVLSDGLKLQYNRARYYDIKNGRWLQRDPSGYADGGNLYESFGGNPSRLRDPLGEDVIDAFLGWFYRYGTPEGVRQTAEEQMGVRPLDPITAASRERERMMIGTLGPPAKTAIRAARRTVITGFGAVGAVGGTAETYIGVVLFVPSLGTSSVFIIHGADVAQAGFWQAESGEWTPTLTQEAITAAGYPRVAIAVDLGASLASGGAALASELRVLPASARAATTMAGEGRAVSAEASLILRLHRRLFSVFGAEPRTVTLGMGVSPGAMPATRPPASVLNILNPAFAPSEETLKIVQLYEVLTPTAADVQATVAGIGARAGTLKHAAVANAIRGLGLPDVLVEQSFRARGFLEGGYGARGSIRADVVLGNPKTPIAVFDYKFGQAVLTPARLQELQAGLPPGTRIIVVRPGP